MSSLNEAGIDVQSINANPRIISNQVSIYQLDKLKDKWRSDVNRVNARQGNGKHKLRLYCPLYEDLRTAYFAKIAEEYSTDIVFLCNENAYQTVAKHPPNFAFCQRSNTVFRISQSDERFLKP